MALWGPQIPSLGLVPLFPGAWDGRGLGSRGQSRERPGRVYREASISQGLLLSEFRIKGLRREEVQRKWDVGHLVKRAVRAPRAWVLTLFPASAERRPGRHLSHQRRGPPGPGLEDAEVAPAPGPAAASRRVSKNVFSPGPGEISALGLNHSMFGAWGKWGGWRGHLT